MLEAAREALSLAETISREELETDRRNIHTFTRLLEIIGEAARNISADIQGRHPDISWAQMIGTRNRLIHGYTYVDLDVVWDIVRNDLLRLIPQLESLLAELES